MNELGRDLILFGDCRNTLPLFPEQARMCVTSPPYYGLRDYGGEEKQIGQEKTPEEYIETLVEVFSKVRDCLTDDGTLWLNIGDSYVGTGHKGDWKDPKYKEGRTGQTFALNNKVEGLKSKDLIGIPWMLAFALRADGWYLRQDIIWHKPNAMPESVKDRCTKAHEYVFLLSKNKHYYYDNEAIKEPTVTRTDTVRDRDKGKLNNTEGRSRMGGLKTNNYEKRNKRSVWSVSTKPYKGAHFAVFPADLIEPCILAGSEKGDLILDPFMGSGTTAVVTKTLGRDYIGCELHESYGELIEKRINEMPIPEATLFD